ncbi:targeting protein for Xklp2 isoform X2 [Clupea harengus]|uniref:Targeting protein for Xklp2 isoform X2 n=1 Tax=Clupea harengus TaxID=7950 RepID=A0A6P3W2K7_CLUHA|nr:targeting protein for Xklp2 isoform X2 [Clupea harengus]
MDMQPAGTADPYEFDAPSHVMDFKSLQADDADADQWFEASNLPADRLVTPKPDKPVGGTRGNRSTALLSKEKESCKEDAVEDNPPSNIVLSWGNSKPAAPAPTQTKAQPRRVSKRPVVEPKAATPPVKKQRRTFPTPKRALRPLRSSSHTQRQRKVVRSSRRLSQKPAASTAKIQTSEAPATSTVQSRSTEQQEMERIEALQSEVAEHRRRNEASYKAALAGSQPPKPKQVLLTTVPKEFNFRSDARTKRSATASGSAYAEVDFVSQLRKHQASPVKAMKGTTIPKPFNLSRGKRKHEETAAYVPMAQKIEQYQRRTPTRYHLRSRQSQERGPSPVKNERPKVTNPMTPQLMTRQRGRPQLVKSTAEIEAEELEKIQKFKFKALELNRKILEAAVVPKKPLAKEATQPECFHLEIEKRLHERQASKKPKEVDDYTFHSNPVPARIMEEVVGVPEKRVAPPTVPESPAFALRNRVRVERKFEEVKPAPIKAVPVPHSVPFHPKLLARSVVEMCPFSFEERERERRTLKEKKLEELRKEESHEFKATPLPDFNEISLPEKKVVEPTKLEPFRLQIDERGALKSDRWERMMKEELKQQAEAATFKARPNTVTHKEPFVPKKENRSILATEEFHLYTERRAKERQDFEQEKSERETHRALQEQDRLQEQEEQQREEMARLRQEMVHKAQPVRHYKQVEVKKSELPLTIPHSPNFTDRFRM